MRGTIPAILMLSPHGASSTEQWVAEGRLAAASDLVERLCSTQRYDPILIFADDPADASSLAQHGAVTWQPGSKSFHFGRALHDCVHEHQFRQIAYFGGASAPLLRTEKLEALVDRLDGKTPMALTNNLHSSDWFITNDVSCLSSYKDRLPSDNQLGWVYAHEAGINVLSEPPSAATRLDIDTPMDFAMLLGHPDVGPHLKQFLRSVPEAITQRMQSVRTVVSSAAKNLTIIGRASSHLWQQLEKQTQIWIRLLVEERGMVASQRLARGEVQSYTALMIRSLGPEAFVRELASMSDAVIWDTRVWMAAEVGWPSPGERFAFDLGQIEAIENEKLRAMAAAIQAAEIPILAGGYGVVAGGLYALLESMSVD